MLMDDKILEAFEFGKIQECKNIKLKLDKHGISWDEFLKWVDEKVNNVMPIKANIPAASDSEPVLKRKCPDCQAWLRLARVNHHPALMVGGDSKCQWICKYCPWEEFSDKPVMEEAKPYLDYGGNI